MIACINRIEKNVLGEDETEETQVALAESM